MDAYDLVAKAVAAWKEGAKNGEWSRLLAMLADDVKVTMPFDGEWRGTKHGRDAAAELFRHAAQDLEIRLDQKATSPLLGDDSVFAIQLVGEGTVGGKPATVPICLWITITDGQIASIREYAGDPA